MTVVDTVKRLEVIATNLLTYLIMFQTTLTVLLTSGWLDTFPEAVRYVTMVLTGIGVVIVFIRRVTPVKEEAKGLLPPEGKPNDWV